MTAPLQPLAGLRVLDFCWIGAGALVTKTLAELGASVYRIESRKHPDNLRLSPPFRPGAEGLEGSGYFASRNPSKKSVSIDMTTDAGRELAIALAGRVDVVTSNFRPGVMQRWGLTFEAIRAVNPSVIYLTMPMQGEEGPHSRFVGFGATIAALGGLVNLSGEEGRTPVGTGTHYPDHIPNPGHTLVALLAAIRHRRRTGEGQAIELSQLESTVNVIGPAVLAAGAGTSPRASGNRIDSASPHMTVECADGSWLALSVESDDQWARLADALGDERARDGRFATLAGRKAHEGEVELLLREVASRSTAARLGAQLDGLGVPNGTVQSSRDVVEDRALWRRGFWQEVEHPVIGSMPISRTPFRPVDRPRPDLERPPLLGEHTREVLQLELGLSDDELDALTDQRVLY